MGNERIQRIRWFEKNDFEMKDPICDVCSEPIDRYPCPVKGSYALCSRCQDKLGIHPGHTEYFETAAYNMALEPKQTGINCGGR